MRNEFGILIDGSADLRASAPVQEDVHNLLASAIAAAAEAGQPYTKTGANGLFERRASLPAELHGISKTRFSKAVDALLERGRIVQAMASGSSTVKWLDVPGGPFALGIGEFKVGAA